MRGITDGTVVEEPFEIKTDSGELLATNELAFRIYYLDTQQRLQSVMAEMVVRMPEGGVFPVYSREKGFEMIFGYTPTLEQMKSFYTGLMGYTGEDCKRGFLGYPG